MVANRSQLDDATDGKYERLNGMVTMLRPPSSLEGAVVGILDMADGSDAHAALSLSGRRRGGTQKHRRELPL